MREDRPLPTPVRLLPAAAAVVIVIALLGGIAAAAWGGSLTDLGEGYGGLWGLPALALTLVALVLGIVSVISILRTLPAGRDRRRIVLVVLAGAWVVAVGYSEVAHAIDPCANGWWDRNSRIGSQPLCERFGPDLNWHTRFHLVAHAAPAAFLAALYLWAVRRWGTRS